MKSKPSSSGSKPKQVSLFDFFGKVKKPKSSSGGSSSTKATVSKPPPKTTIQPSNHQQDDGKSSTTPNNNKIERKSLVVSPAVTENPTSCHVPVQKKTTAMDQNEEQPMNQPTPSQKRIRRMALEDTDDEETNVGTVKREDRPRKDKKNKNSRETTSKRPRSRESVRRSVASQKIQPMDLEDTDEEEEGGNRSRGRTSKREEEEESESEFEADEDAEESELEFDPDEEEHEEDQEEKTPRKKQKTAPLSTSSQKTWKQITPASKQQPGNRVSSTVQKTPQSLGSFTARKITPLSDNSRRQDLALTPISSSTQGTAISGSQGSLRSSQPDSQQQKQQHKPPMFTRNAINPMGTHVHNHLKFLHPPRDSQGRSPDHVDYDCRTLRVSLPDWQRVTGGPMTNAVKQWWDLKSQYFDSILLFKTGKFYELYHMDADIGVQVLGLIYMKDHVAHAGFPEKSYGVMADKLVRAGYKVARVEQTETPDMLKERKKHHKGKDSPKVVNREVCSILTLGTRTCCFMDDTRQVEQHPDALAAVGPLLTIAEQSLDGDNRNEDDHDTTLTREFGVTVVDAPRGWITMGQFQDDCLCSHLQTLLAAYSPSEILYQADDATNTTGSSKHHLTVKSLIVSYRNNAVSPCRIEVIKEKESFPKSTALDPRIREAMQRTSPTHPWDVNETLYELQNRRHKYYFQGNHATESSANETFPSLPPLLKLLVSEPQANGSALSSFGASLYYLQRNLIDAEIMSMGVMKEYPSPTSTLCLGGIRQPQFMSDQSQDDPNKEEEPTPHQSDKDVTGEAAMSLEGTTLHNLEIIANSDDNKEAGSLWSKLHSTKTPHGARLLRAWLLRPLFRKKDIDRRADAVEELTQGGSASIVCGQARKVLAKCGDLERLLSRVHSMSGAGAMNDAVQDGSIAGAHPNERAVLYEEADYTKRKVGDFSKVINGLKQATRLPALFEELQLQEGGLLAKIVKHPEHGGCFPDIATDLEWYFENFDCEKASQGLFEPSYGVDALFDQACETVERIKADLVAYKTEMCQDFLSSQARSAWTYINTKPDSKDKYLIELPASIRVPDDWILKAKRGKGAKQVNKYRTAVVEEMVAELERALETLTERKARAVQLIFARFDANRDSWAAAAQATALLDALCAMAQLASQPGYTRPRILDHSETNGSVLSFRQARHPCVEGLLSSPEFIPNDLALGGLSGQENSERVLLLSGPNMGGKSTFLRQTCILAILAQIGSFVPAEEFELTPIDRIYTRLGASDRILLGQSTFFVELSETSAALRGATSRSLVIMDELGRGTSTFDGTAIAFAAVKHLVERNKCLALFATHYHNLLDDWNSHPLVRLGHMECMVENDDDEQAAGATGVPSRVTFLYTLGNGACPKSFGINVARLAGLPNDVLVKAGDISKSFENEMGANLIRKKVEAAIESNDWEQVRTLWQEVQH